MASEGLELRLEDPSDSQPRDPRIVDETRSETRIERRLEIPEDLVFLRGHFDGFPVVAGVVQLRWVMDALQALRGETPQTLALEALKFPEPLLPGRVVSLELEVADSGDFVRFRLWEGGSTFAKGRWRGREKC